RIVLGALLHRPPGQIVEGLVVLPLGRLERARAAVLPCTTVSATLRGILSRGEQRGREKENGEKRHRLRGSTTADYSRRMWLRIWTAILFVTTIVMCAACGGNSVEVPADVAAPPPDAIKTPSGLASRVLKPGTGTRHPAATDRVTVHYSG